jgi:hypothetical protein
MLDASPWLLDYMGSAGLLNENQMACSTYSSERARGNDFFAVVEEEQR